MYHFRMRFLQNMIGSILLSAVLLGCNKSEVVEGKPNQALSKTDSVAMPYEKSPEKPFKKPLDSGKYYVYLTFDDGPYKGSVAVNNIVKQEQVHVTAFVVGAHVTNDRARQIIADYQSNPYVEVANHSFSHANNKYAKYYANPKVAFDDIVKNHILLKFDNKDVRLPGRNIWYGQNYNRGETNSTANKTAKLLVDEGYSIYGWDLEWHRKQAGIEEPQVMYHQIINMIEKNRTMKKNHLVLLAHDDMFNKDKEAEKLSTLIQLLKSNTNVELAPVSEYPLDGVSAP